MRARPSIGLLRALGDDRIHLGETDWGITGLYLVLLLGVTAAMAAFGAWAFRIYRRTL
jgi:hypothetical protein